MYEYQCRKCSKTFEFLILTKQEEEFANNTLCDSCNGPLEKIISLSNFKLLGCGWSKDNYGGTKVEVADES